MKSLEYLDYVTEAFSAKNKQEHDIIEQILQPRDDLQFETFSNTCEIEDIFEEFHKNSYLNRDPNTHKYLTKLEANIKTFNQFTDEFKKTIGNIRQELKINRNLLDKEKEKLGTITKTNPTYNSEAINNELEHLLNSIPSLNLKNQDFETCSSLISDVWNILETVNSTNFRISPPEYHAYNQDEQHWLQRVPISWEEVEKSRIKCEKWLEQCHD